MTVLIKTKPLRLMDNWGVKAAMTKNVAFSPDYVTMRIGDVLQRVRDAVKVEDDEWYEAIKVKYYNGGVESRGKQKGRDIKSKRQFRVEQGQLVLSKIDARHGAIGVIPEELSGAIITNNFIVYRVDYTRALPEFMELLLTSDSMRKKIADDSSGATNREYLQEKKFLAEPIALPPIGIQREMARAFNVKKAEAEKADDRRKEKEDKAKKDINEKLKARFRTVITGKSLLTEISLADMTRWDVGYYKEQNVLTASYQMLPLGECIDRMMSDEEGRSLRMNAETAPANCKYIGMDAIEKGTGLAKENLFVDVKQMKGDMTRVPKGYLIFGKLRPKLNKFWLNRKNEGTQSSSSEFLVFRMRETVSAEYMEAVLFGEIVKRQVEVITSGARMPRIKEQDMLEVMIPVPPLQVQQEVAKIYQDYIREKSQLELRAEEARDEARKAFDSVLFN